MSTSFLWFKFHSHIRKEFRVKFLIVFGSSLSSLIGFSLHYRRWDRSYFCDNHRSYLCKSYRSNNVLRVLRACCPNHHIQSFVEQSFIFIGVCKDRQFKSIFILSPP
jgi:hypothetical protein